MDRRNLLSHIELRWSLAKVLADVVSVTVSSSKHGDQTTYDDPCNFLLGSDPPLRQAVSFARSSQITALSREGGS